MDPFTVSAAAMSVVLVAQSVKSNLEQWVRDRSLPEALAQQDEDVLPVVAVHLRHLGTAPEHVGEPLKIRVKYGARGENLWCDTARFSPELPKLPRISRLVHRRQASQACMQLDSTCLFLLSEDVEPVIRLSVRKAGLRRCTVAKASVPLAQLLESGVAELPLHGPSGSELGHISIACEVLEVLPQDLTKSLALTHVNIQKAAYLITGATPTVEGDLVDEGSETDESTTPVAPTTLVEGQRISMY